ncbi:DEAD-box ATP-dependent RNA helicase 42 [Brassica rapa]|uniref:DEAD-box ATP-dependent RNA helicase 42 n=1 Tax=Brassica campestris TaxID=3711 RepID=UPI00142DA5FE|nr:DEAD-box ATP-dependent RNA helicase 42 [Brassica rapa]
MEAKNRRDRGRDRSEERRKGKRLENNMRKRRCESVRSIDSEDERDRYVGGGQREKRKEKDKDRRRRAMEKGGKNREHERDRGQDRKRGREGSEESGDDVKRRRQEDNGEKKEAREEEVEDGVKQLDEEAEKRRRRLHEWQEMKKKKEETKSENKSWNLEGESDDEQVPPQTETDDAMMVDLDEEVIDPLDAFMNTMVLPEVEKLSNAASPLGTVLDSNKDINKAALGWIIQGEDSDSDYSATKYDDDQPSMDKENVELMKKTKGDKLTLVDHSNIEYQPFRKNFYIQVKDISNLTEQEVNTHRKELEIKVHGKDVPRPIKSWHQTGLTTRILNTIKKLNFQKPTPVQAQALPLIMSGRDCIGVAPTGSGKTLSFVLPMLRHINSQPPVEPGDGPIGLVMAPTRELVQQIHTDIKKFAKSLSIRCVAVYGGSGVAQQISELKRGTEIIVCTPERMIDILSTNSGKVTNLQRVTFLVMDEADRMFDMGFEPQITRIIQNIRPDRQTVLFSATFPRQVEALARKVLNKPVEIQAGGRSVVNKDITQFVEIKLESEKRPRLVELIEEWYDKGKVLVFVGSQEKCDGLYNDLKNKCGYRCQSLHGGKDQIHREVAVSEFKSSVCNLLVATSVAARGLDVKEVELVVNFDAPNHYEEYVHRVGRTGRAGRKGCAVTFVSEDDARYAPDLVKALERSEQVVPDGLRAMADGFMEKVREGVEKGRGSGFGGSGFKFNEEEDVRRAAKEAQKKEDGVEEEDKSELEDEGEISQQKQKATMVVAAMLRGCARTQQHYEGELEINDFPQNARWRVTRRETLGSISDWSGAAITTRGQFFTPGRVPGHGERKLYLFIERTSEESVKAAKGELMRVVNDITSQALSLPGRSSQHGRYSVL